MPDRMAKAITKGLREAVRDMPAGFHDSFDYTRTGNNLCHPVTLGTLAKIVSFLPGVAYVGIDVHLNRGNGIKFQPDVIGYKSDSYPAVFVDFESPNSSDARVPGKDVGAYLEWVTTELAPPPYVIVTSLPDEEAPRWQLRYTAEGYYNYHHRDARAEIRKNPYRYWLGAWRSDLTGKDLTKIAFININGKKVERFSI